MAAPSIAQMLAPNHTTKVFATVDFLALCSLVSSLTFGFLRVRSCHYLSSFGLGYGGHTPPALCTMSRPTFPCRPRFPVFASPPFVLCFSPLRARLQWRFRGLDHHKGTDSPKQLHRLMNKVPNKFPHFSQWVTFC